MIERLTAADADERMTRVASVLNARGLHSGDRIAIDAHNTIDTLVLALSALRLGIVPVMMNPSLLPHERAVILDDCTPTLSATREIVGELMESSAVRMASELSDVPLLRPMHYTSGTTGKPKGVYSGVLSTADAQLLLADETEQWGFCSTDVNLVVSPLYHSAPLRFAAGTLFAGGDVVMLNKFTPQTAREAIHTHAVTSAFMAPAHLQRLFAESGPLDLSSFRLLAHAGAPCPVAVKEQAIASFPSGAVWEFYGSTEGQFTVCSSDDWQKRPGTVGRARARRRIFTLEEERGSVLWCEVPSYARFTYWNDPAKTASAWRGDAFSVFDVGRVDDDGYVYLEGRRDDLIISGGVNVYPLELEIALSACPGVAEVVVYPKPDERWGQQVCAAVVCDPNAPVSDVDLRAFAESALAPYKRPKHYTFITADQIPRTPTGKVLRSRFAAMLA